MMLDNQAYFYNWWGLFLEISIYSFVITLIALVIVFIFIIVIIFITPVKIERSIRRYIFIILGVSVLSGLFAYLLGVMSSFSRNTGNPALISALIPAFAVAVLYFKEKSITTMTLYVVLSMVFIVNIFAGVYFGSGLRFQSTESTDALRAQAIKEYQIRQFRKNLGLPVEGDHEPSKN